MSFCIHCSWDGYDNVTGCPNPDCVEHKATVAPPQPTAKPVRESAIEQAVVKHAQDLGFIAYKFVSPGRVGVPDRIFVSPQGLILWVEFKSPTGKLTHRQHEELTALAMRRCEVAVVDDIAKGKALLTLASDAQAWAAEMYGPEIALPPGVIPH